MSIAQMEINVAQGDWLKAFELTKQLEAVIADTIEGEY